MQAGNHALNNPLPSSDAFVYAQMAEDAALDPATAPGSYQTASPVNLGTNESDGSEPNSGSLCGLAQRRYPGRCGKCRRHRTLGRTGNDRLHRPPPEPGAGSGHYSCRRHRASHQCAGRRRGTRLHRTRVRGGRRRHDRILRRRCGAPRQRRRPDLVHGDTDFRLRKHARRHRFRRHRRRTYERRDAHRVGSAFAW